MAKSSLKGSKIYEIAKRARRACEIFAWSEDARKYDFYFNTHLECMCGVASFFLRDVALREGMVLRIHSDNEHCFCEKDGIVIDITATQFGARAKVHLGLLKNYKYAVGSDKVRHINCQSGWPKSQKYNKKAKKHLWEIYEKLLTKEKAKV
jgi:hypothetical protein